jgi:dihydrofolate reductase
VNPENTHEGDKMRNVIVSTYATLDGRVDDPQEWTVPYDDPGVIEYHTALLKNSDGLLLGRKTYQLFAAIWPMRAGGPVRYVDKLNNMAKYVASTTLEDLEWENSHLIEGDVAEGVAKLKQEPGQDLVLYGCHDLMHTLIEADLIDEYRILVSPVLVGKGRTLLQDGGPRVDLELVDTTVISSRGVLITAKPAR